MPAADLTGGRAVCEFYFHGAMHCLYEVKLRWLGVWPEVETNHEGKVYRIMQGRVE
jgi:hypothetical protein